jgi:hypothetical protein
MRTSSRELIEKVRSLHPILDPERQLEIREGEFLSKILEDTGRIEEIEEIADREKEISELLDSARQTLEESQSVLDHQETVSGNLEKINEQVEELNSRLREAHNSLNEETGDGDIIEPLELSIDLEIAIEDLQNLRQMSEEQLDNLGDQMDMLIEDTEDLVDRDDETLERIQKRLEDMEGEAIDAADAVNTEEIEKTAEDLRQRVEEIRRNTSGEKNVQAAELIEKIDEMEKLLPEYEDPKSPWQSFLRVVRGENSSLEEGIEEIDPEHKLLEDTSIYPRIMNSVRLVGREKDIDIDDIKIYRHFQVEDNGTYSYSKSRIEMEINIDGDPSELIDRTAYNVFRHESRIQALTLRGSRVVHVPPETAGKIREIFEDFKTWETELENVSEALENGGLE